ncbi:MAG: cation diffusion facilitator family transporter [Calditrichota bacterium]
MPPTDRSTTSRNIRIVFILNLLFTAIEIIGGFLTNSMAILSDALHDLGDSFALGITLILDKLSHRVSDEKYSYGYQRFNLLAALINTIILVIGSIFIFSEAIPRLSHPEHSNAQGMVIFAIIGIVVNGAAALRLRGSKSQNTKIIAWHLLEDVLGWTAVLIVAFVLLFKDVHILDPLLSILITVYVLYNVLKNLKKTLSLFMQGVPEDIEIKKLEENILNQPRVKSVHHTHIWSLDGENHVLTTHVVVYKNTTRIQISQIKKSIMALISGHHFEHTTIEIEYEDENCNMNQG